MFAYCNNNPVTSSDQEGYVPSTMTTDEGAFPITWWEEIIEYCKGTINGQGREPYSSIHYGLSNLRRSGCEVIACFNLMKILGRRGQSLDIIIDYFVEAFCREPMMGNLAFGLFGAHPFLIGDYLGSQNINFSSFDDRTFIDNNNCYGVYIVSFWNEDIKHEGYHTVAIRFDNTGYTIYNKTNGSYLPEKHADIDYIKGSFIYGYFIPFNGN